MRLSGLDQVPDALKGGVVAIGNFDGFHRGHQHVFAALKARAAERGAPAIVVTFEPHPRDVFAPAPFMFRLTGPDAKARLAEALGLDGIVVMPFDRAFSQIEAKDFVSRFLVDALAAKGVIIGADFHFGRNRLGTPDFLRAALADRDCPVEVLDLVEDNGDSISSSRIRTALAAGELDEANALLGYHWFIEGEVVAGDRRGRELGFPTANIASDAGFGLAQGVYAVRGLIGGRLVDGVASYGKPMFDNQRPPFEPHFFGFNEDIYGERISVALIAHIRGQKIFSGLDELIAAIDADSFKAKRLLAAAKPISDLDQRLGFFR
ncbi:MAG TPA: bifunctional riboflavin kinase/FAD synthetase [Devosiaceae bacterium]|nr:bifunctional riboflavin kinase/FAD synthetase [Devosiaceae bacterium]